MFGWGRKTDGFEWHKYVRTTIRLKREDRRIRVEGVKLAALDGLKDAGRESARAGVSGLAVLWSGVWSVVRWTVEATTTGVRAMARATAKTAIPAAGRLLASLDPLGKRLAHGGLAAVLAIAGLVALLAATARTRGAWYTGDAALPAIIAILALAASLIPLLTGHLRIKWLSSVDRAASRLKMRAPSLAKLSPGQSRGLVLGAAVLVALGVGYWSLRGRTALPQLASFTPFAAKPLEGKASVVTGDVVRIGTTNVRLSGIEAPDAEQKCLNSAKKRWPCGEAAQASLGKLVRGKTVRCELSGTDDEGRARGTCSTVNVGTPQDVAAALVKEGAVFSSGGLWSGYGGLESEAKARKIGLWRGEADRPSEYRSKLWEQAKRSAPEGCPIKGQVAGDNRTYVLPWSSDYSNVKVRTGRGERWFCSEAEAKAAGWKTASR